MLLSRREKNNICLMFCLLFIRFLSLKLMYLDLLVVRKVYALDNASKINKMKSLILLLRC